MVPNPNCDAVVGQYSGDREYVKAPSQALIPGKVPQTQLHIILHKVQVTNDWKYNASSLKSNCSGKDKSKRW